MRCFVLDKEIVAIVIAVTTENMFDVEYLEGNAGWCNDDREKMIQFWLFVLVTIEFLILFFAIFFVGY